MYVSARISSFVYSDRFVTVHGPVSLTCDILASSASAACEEYK